MYNYKKIPNHPNTILFLIIVGLIIMWATDSLIIEFGIAVGLIFYLCLSIHSMAHAVYKKFSVQGEEEAMENTLEVLGLLQQKQQKQKAHGHGREMSPDPEAPEDTDIMDGIDGGAN